MSVHLDRSFKIIDKDKRNMGIVLFIIFLINVGMLIATSGYSVDLGISVGLRKGMKNQFLRGLGAFTISDGYNALVTYSVPMGIVVLESIFVGFKTKQKVIPQGLIKSIFWIAYAAIFITFEYNTIANMGSFLDGYTDLGFGTKFVGGFIIDGAYYYPIWIVSILLNTGICVALLGYIHFHLARRKDFLDSRYGASALQGLLYIGLMYAVYTKVSAGMDRPHPYRVKGGDFLNEMSSYDNGKGNDRVSHYLEQTKYNGGGITDSGKNNLNFEGEWPGGKVGDTGAYRKHPIENPRFLPDADFPSGHVCELVISMNSLMIIFADNKKNRKIRNIRVALFSIMILGGVDMNLSMLVMQGHWESDMAFSFVGAFPAYFLSGLGIDIVFKGIPESEGFKKIFNKSVLFINNILSKNRGRK